MAEAEGPSSVLGQVVAPLLEHDEIVLTRVWFMDDRDCTVCQGRRDAASGTTLHLRAHGSRLGSATSSAGLDGACHLVRVGTQSRIAEIAARGEALLSSRVEPLDDWGVEVDLPGHLRDTRRPGLPAAVSRARRRRSRLLSPHPS